MRGKSVETKSENGTQNTSCKLQSHVGPVRCYLVATILSRVGAQLVHCERFLGVNLTEIGGEPKRMTVGAPPFTRYLKKIRW